MTSLLTPVNNHALAHNYILEGKLRGIIFDLDNTLVSSSLNFTEIKKALDCPPNDDVLQFVSSLPKEQQVEANAIITDCEVVDANSSTLLPGTASLLALLNSLNLPCAIVTRNCKEATKVKLARHAIDIELILTREDHKAKPAPDALLYIAELWQLAPDNLLYVGDYLYDVQAAKNANMHSCLLTFGRKLNYAHQATWVAQDLAELNNALTLVLRKSACTL